MLDPSARAAHNAVQRNYYEGRSPEENFRLEVRNSPYIENHVKRLVHFAGLRLGEHILDIGCGMGKYTLPLLRQGLSVEALDLSPKLLAALEQQTRSREQIRLHCGDVLDPSPDLCGRFDVVTGFFMLHHLYDLIAGAQQISRLLRPGGRVAFVDVNPWCPLYYLQISISPNMSWAAEKGILNLTRSKVTAALTSAGFRDVKIDQFGILPPALRNGFAGAAIEEAFDGLRVFKPVSAFQLISARLDAEEGEHSQPADTPASTPSEGGSGPAGSGHSAV